MRVRRPKSTTVAIVTALIWGSVIVLALALLIMLSPNQGKQPGDSPAPEPYFSHQTENDG